VKFLRAALKNLPSGSIAYDHAYNDAMFRIEGQVTDQEDLAKQVLSWITCAERPLNILELQYALAVEAGESELDEDNLPELEDMVSVCAGLVTIDKESNIIRLVHYTTQEYFERTQSYWFPNAQAGITATCVSYLSFDAFERGFCQTDDEFEDRLLSSRFFEYAAQNWGHHARKASTLSQVLSQAILNGLTCKARVNAWSQGLLAIKRYSSHSNYSQKVGRGMIGLHLAAHFGIQTVIKPLLLLDTSEIDTVSKDDNGQTPLCIAAANGFEAVVKLLLDADKVDINSKDKDGRTPLHLAARNGQEAVVKLLLESGKADVDSRANDSEAPLHLAARYGHGTVIKLLLDLGKADADSKTDAGWTPLYLASHNGHETVVKLLLDISQVDADSTDILGFTPLFMAALNGNEAVAKLLLDTGKADADTKDQVGQTPLHLAAQQGHETIVKLLLSVAKINAAWMDKDGQTPLHLAARNGHGTVVKLLRDIGKVDAA
jgi:ankyrin repeat protein